VFSVQVDWLDGSTATIAGLGAGNASGTVGDTSYQWDGSTRSLQLSHQYLDDGPTTAPVDTYNVSLTVSDDDLDSSGPYVAPVIVNNVPPFLISQLDQDVNEGQLLDLSGLSGAPPLALFIDPGTLDTHTATVDWGDGSLVENATVFAGMGSGTIGGTHVYADDGQYKVTVTVTDKDGETDTDSFMVQVHTVVPTLIVPGPQMVEEGSPLTITNIGTITDPGFDNPDNPNEPPSGSVETFTYWINWGDGNIDTGSATIDDVGAPFDLTDASFDGAHTYANDGPYTVTIRIADDNMTGNFVGGVNTVDYVEQTIAVTVKNDVPELVDVTGSTIQENGIATVSATIVDAGSQDVFSVDVNWQDGTSDTITGLGNSDVSNTIGGTTYVWIAATQQLQLSHQYLDDGASPGNNTIQDDYGVTLVVHDETDTGVQQTATVTVQNVVPQLGDPSNVTILENGTAVLVTTVTDPGTQDVFSVDVNWQDGTNNTITGLGLSNTSGTVGGTSYVWAAATRQLQLSHQYLDDGASPGNGTVQDDYGVTITVHDDDLGTSLQQTATVTVQNVVPQISDPADTTILENGTATLTTTITDPGTQDVFSVDVNWQDGTSNTITGLGLSDASGTVGGTDYVWTAATRVLQVSHQYLDDGVSPGNGTIQDDYAVALTVHDDDLGTGVAQSATVTVQNVAPQISDPADTTILENGTATLTTTITDPGTQDVFSVDVNWQDGTSDTITGLGGSDVSNTIGGTTYVWMAATRQLQLSHQYLDDGTSPGNNTIQDDYGVTLVVHDDDLGTGLQQTATVTVQNVAPQLSDPSDVTILENGTAVLTTTVTDPGTQDVFSVDVNWQDGTSNTVTGLGLSDAAGTVGGTTYAWTAATRQLQLSHQYLDDGTSPGNNTTQDDYGVTLTVHDDDLGTGLQQTATVTVQNVVPQVALNLVSAINENGVATLAGSYTDIGQLDGHTLTIDWNDPNNSNDSTFDIPAIQSTLSIGSMISSSTDGAVLTISGIDPTTGQVTFSVQHQYLDDGPAPGNGTTSDVSIIGVTVADDDAQSGSNTTTVTVHNVAPVFQDVVGDSIDEGDVATVSMNFSDPGQLDVFTANVNWKDGSTATISGLGSVDSSGVVGSTTFEWTAATRQLTVSHLYADNANYEVVVRVADDDMAANFAGSAGPGNFVEITTSVNVANVPPTLAGTTSLTVNEGSPLTLNGLGVHLEDVGFDNPANQTPPPFGDQFQETFTSYTIDWGDGTSDTPVNVVMRTSGGPGVPTTALFDHASHTYADNGVYTVRVRVADDNMSGNFTTGTNGVDYVDLEFTITVANVAPTLAAPAPSAANINENGSVNFTISFTDPGFDNAANDNTPPNGGEVAETFTYDIDWGDGRHTVSNVAVGATPGGVGVPSAGSFGENHIYADDGNYTVTVNIHDDDGGVATQTFVVSVQNTNPVIVTPLNGDDVTAQGITRIRFAFSDLGFDNPANQTPPPNGDQFAETFTYVVDWGDGTVDTITVSQVSPGSPLVVNSQTTVLASARTSGSEGVSTTGSFEVEHQYNGPPDPLHPAADIVITVTLIDDNGGTVSDAIAIGNPGIDVVNVAIDTTPDVPRLEYVPQQMVQVLLDRTTTTPQTLQTLNTRVASSELTLTSDRYLELNVISPEGKVIAQYRLKDEALTDLRGLIATLPDGHYKIYLVRTDNNSRRLVLDVNVRQGRVVDPSDDSEGTRDRPPIEGGQQNQAQPLENNPQLQRVQEQNPPAAMNDSTVPMEQVSTIDEVAPVVAVEGPSSARLRWAAPLAGLGLVAQRGSWSREVGAAFDKADEQAWQRLRRAGRRRLVK
jgi:hypothetical protein